MATDDSRKKSALLDWKNEKKYREQIAKSPTASAATKKAAAARVKEADKWIKKLSK